MTPQEIKQDKISNARSHHRNSYADILEHLPDSLFTDIDFVLDDSCIPYLDDEGKKLYAERKKEKLIKTSKNRFCKEYIKLLEILPASVFLNSFSLTEDCLQYLDEEGKKLFFAYKEKKKSNQAKQCLKNIHNNPNLKFQKKYSFKELYLLKKRRRISHYYNEFSQLSELLKKLPLSSYDGDFELSPSLRDYFEDEETKALFDKTIQEYFNQRKINEKRGRKINNQKNASGFTKIGNTTSVIIRKKNGLPKQQKKEETTETQMLLPPSKTKKVKKIQNENIGRIECPVCERLLPHNEFKSPYRFACVRCELINSKLRPELNNYAELSIDVRNASERGDTTAYISLRNKLSVAYYKLKSKCKAF